MQSVHWRKRSQAIKEDDAPHHAVNIYNVDDHVHTTREWSDTNNHSRILERQLAIVIYIACQAACMTAEHICNIAAFTIVFAPRVLN